MLAKKKYTPQPFLPMDKNIWGVKRLMMKFLLNPSVYCQWLLDGRTTHQNQLLAAADACPRLRTLWSNISEFKTQGVPFHEGV